MLFNARARLVLAASMVVLLSACATISPFSPRAYELATSLKVDSLALMSKASEPFSTHRAAVEHLKLDIDKAYEFARGRPKNETSTEQWAVLRDPNRDLLGGFLRRWEQAPNGKLNPVIVKEMRGNIADAFDAIIQLESGKRRADGKEK